jgi:DNA-binding NarL/FixJ family response regulator
MPIRIVLADDHAMIRQGLKVILEAEGFQVAGEAFPAQRFCQEIQSSQPLSLSYTSADSAEICLKGKCNLCRVLLYEFQRGSAVGIAVQSNSGSFSDH